MWLVLLFGGVLLAVGLMAICASMWSSKVDQRQERVWKDGQI